MSACLWSNGSGRKIHLGYLFHEQELRSVSLNQAWLTLQTNIDSEAKNQLQSNANYEHVCAASLITKQPEFTLAERQRVLWADPLTSWQIGHPEVWLQWLSFHSLCAYTISSHPCHCINKGMISARRYIMQVSPYQALPSHWLCASAVLLKSPSPFNPHSNKGLFLCFILK